MTSPSESAGVGRRSYHFSLGDSSTGPVGFCARVVADSEESALAALRAQLEDMNREVAVAALNDDIDHLAIYFNPAAISKADIDEVDDADELLADEEA